MKINHLYSYNYREDSSISQYIDELYKMPVRTLVDSYQELIEAAIREDRLKTYVADFLSERNKPYHGELCTKFFRQALQRVSPAMVEWFDRITVLR